MKLEDCYYLLLRVATCCYVLLLSFPHSTLVYLDLLDPFGHDMSTFKASSRPPWPHWSWPHGLFAAHDLSLQVANCRTWQRNTQRFKSIECCTNLQHIGFVKDMLCPVKSPSSGKKRRKRLQPVWVAPS